MVADDGVGADDGHSPWTMPLDDSALGEVVRTGQTHVRGDLKEGARYAEEEHLAAIGMRSRVIAPLAVAGKPLGVISVSRREPDSFTRDDVDLLTLLGRQLATAVENIRAFEAERAAAEELRRLSALRADFVSLVTHELRGPMASVVGCAATLRQRWRTLNEGQRESFLALIEEETSRLAALVGDVLDTSRLEAGTFTYAFTDVDVEALVREVAAVVDLGHEEVAIRTKVPGPLPTVRGDRERIRQVVMNLLTNAVKYTVVGDEVEVLARVDNGSVAVSVSDHGPGISAEEQRVIFEKFGRAANAGSSSTARRRPRALHRPLDHRGARRLARGRVAAGPGRDVHRPPSRQRVLAVARRFLVSVFCKRRGPAWRPPRAARADRPRRPCPGRTGSRRRATRRCRGASPRARFRRRAPARRARSARARSPCERGRGRCGRR